MYVSPLRNLPAGVYDVPVYRGPDFDDIDDDKPDHPGSGPGVVEQPKDTVLQEWAKCWVSDGPEFTWSPRRSCVVVWEADPSHRLWYSAGDSGMFEIGWKPSDAFGPLMTRLSDSYHMVCKRFDAFVRAAYADAGRRHAGDAAIAMDTSHGHWLEGAIQ